MGAAFSVHNGFAGGGGGGGGVVVCELSVPPLVKPQQSPPKLPSDHANAAAGESESVFSVIIGMYINIPMMKVITARKPMIAENFVIRCI
jgi:hypothetical protein